MIDLLGLCTGWHDGVSHWLSRRCTGRGSGSTHTLLHTHGHRRHAAGTKLARVTWTGQTTQPIASSTALRARSTLHSCNACVVACFLLGSFSFLVQTESSSRLVRKVKFFATEDSFPPQTNPFFPKMRHLAAYLLLRLGGNNAPDAAAVTAVLTSVGVEADAEAVAKLIADLEGKVRCRLRVRCDRRPTPHPAHIPLRVPTE